MSAHTNTRIVTVLIALFVASAFAGCFGDDEKADPAKGKDQGPALPGVPTPGGDEGPPPTEHTSSADPKAHFHHLWNDREEVYIWNEAPVVFKTYDTTYLGDYNSMTWAEFDLEMDGDQVKDAEANEAAPNNHADVVFAGTDYIEARFPEGSSFFDGATQLRMYWKPANTNVFGGGTTAAPGEVVRIHLSQTGMSDPPHQNAVSRWKFRLVVFDMNNVCQLELGVCPPAFASEEPDANREVRMDGFQMIAHNGGAESLDPPHPDFWGTNTVIQFETIERQVSEPIVQTPVLRERSPALVDIAPRPGDLVPMGAERVEVKVTWSTPQAPEGFLLKLRYHGADTLTYQDAQPVDEKTGASATSTYVIYNVVNNQDLGLVDPPYESRSFWRFELVPSIRAGDQDSMHTGVFQGNYSLEITVHKQEGFILT